MSAFAGGRPTGVWDKVSRLLTEGKRNDDKCNPEQRDECDNRKEAAEREEFLQTAFSEDSRPSLRWLREQQKRRPSIHQTRASGVFDPDEVRAALRQRHTIMPRRLNVG
jgi:hypothetical protein